MVRIGRLVKISGVTGSAIRRCVLYTTFMAVETIGGSMCTGQRERRCIVVKIRRHPGIFRMASRAIHTDAMIMIRRTVIRMIGRTRVADLANGDVVRRPLGKGEVSRTLLKDEGRYRCRCVII